MSIAGQGTVYGHHGASSIVADQISADGRKSRRHGWLTREGESPHAEDAR